MKKITTRHGTVALPAATDEQMTALRSSLPFGLFNVQGRHPTAKAALVMQCGDFELKAMKFQVVDTDEKKAISTMNRLRYFIAATLPTYCSASYQGVLLPAAYLKQKSSTDWESGIAVFPMAVGDVQTSFAPRCGNDPAAELGAKSAAMGEHFRGSVLATVKKMGGTLRFIDINIRNRLELGMIMFDLLVHDKTIFCIKCDLMELDPIWSFCAQAQAFVFPHLPAVPAAIPAEQLAFARGFES